MSKTSLIRRSIALLLVTVIIAVAVEVLNSMDSEKREAEIHNQYTSNKLQTLVNDNTTEVKDTDEVDMPDSDLSGEEETINVEEESTISPDGLSVRTNEGARIYKDVDPDKPMISLSFDDGPNKKSTEKILAALEKYNARATFFVVGCHAEENKDVVKHAYEIGCEIGSHTYNHKELTTLSPQQIKSEIEKTNNLIKDITNQKRVLIRPPYGAVDDKVLKRITSPIILWSLDTEDWLSRDTDKVIDEVINNVSDGDIVLMHDYYMESANAAEVIIEKLTEKGYQLVTVSELGYHKLGGLATGVKYGAMKGD